MAKPCLDSSVRHRCSPKEARDEESGWCLQTLTAIPTIRGWQGHYKRRDQPVALDKAAATSDTKIPTMAIHRSMGSTHSAVALCFAHWNLTSLDGCVYTRADSRSLTVGA